MVNWQKEVRTMKRIPIQPELSQIPGQFHELFRDAKVFNSSCSPDAQVLFIDKGPGFYLKSAAKSTLKREAEMTRFFHEKGLSAEVSGYESLEKDWLLTVKIPGEDCLWEEYLSQPERLCDTTAELLRMLHSQDISGCPVVNRTVESLETARRNYETKAFSTEHFPDNWSYDTPESAWAEIEKNGKYLRHDTLIHGDYCLPNILLNDWKFSGFIDVAAGGAGDRHVDLFWGIWSLEFNLKTGIYRDRFLDAYGREDVSEDALRTIAAIEVFA